MGPVMGLADSVPASAPIWGTESEPSVDGHPAWAMYAAVVILLLRGGVYGESTPTMSGLIWGLRGDLGCFVGRWVGTTWGTSVSASLCDFWSAGGRDAPPPYAFSFPFTPEHYMCLLVTEAGSQMGNA